MNLIEKIKYAKQLVKSNYGRTLGWIVELDGQPIAELEDYAPDSMFSYSYKIVCKSESDKLIAYDPTRWDECDFDFVNCVTGERVSDALAVNGPEYIHNGRISIRALNLWPRNKIEVLIVDFLSILKRLKILR